MSAHFNLIADTNPEKLCEESQKKIARHIFELNNQARYTFDSADHYKEVDMTRKEAESELLKQRLINPPMVKRKFPILKQYPVSGKKTFDSADYFLEVYGKTPVNCRYLFEEIVYCDPITFHWVELFG